MSQPRIAIGMNYRALDDGTERAYLDEPYYRALLELGATVCPVPPVADHGMVDRMLAGVDGLLMTGGLDLDPALWDEPRHQASELVHPIRQAFDFQLYEQAVRRGLPILGICLGLQVICVAHGGRLYQHLPEQPGQVDHGRYGQDVFHRLSLRPSRLKDWARNDSVLVPSAHHQGVRDAGRGLVIAGQTGDGVIEAVERADYPFALAVQWHPERYYNKEPFNGVIMTEFVKACASYADRRS